MIPSARWKSALVVEPQGLGLKLLLVSRRGFPLKQVSMTPLLSGSSQASKRIGPIHAFKDAIIGRNSH